VNSQGQFAIAATAKAATTALAIRSSWGPNAAESASLLLSPLSPVDADAELWLTVSRSADGFASR
jgi:hypothetical protein